MASLWVALGSPSPTHLVPLRRTRAWKEAAASLRSALSVRSCYWTPASWQALWRLLHPASPPASTTWEALLSHHTLDTLIRAHTESISSEAPLVMGCWNARWLMDPHADVSVSKRNVVMRRILRGQPVLLQETHWTDAHASQWDRLFPTAAVYASPASTPRGEKPTGGVATLLPRGWECVSSRTLFPGCALEVVARHGGRTVCFWNLYLPPSDQSSVLHALLGLQAPPQLIL